MLVIVLLLLFGMYSWTKTEQRRLYSLQRKYVALPILTHRKPLTEWRTLEILIS